MTTELARPGQKPYRPYGAAETLLYDKSPEIILDGPAGTGKSRACLEKIMICADRYPGSRLLIVRKTRASLTQTALVSWESDVLPEAHTLRRGPQREQRSSYRHSNGSEIVVGGLGDANDRVRIFSSEYDLIYVQEAREISEGEWEDLTTRLRWGVMPYQQIIGDTNPDTPQHWIKRRGKCDTGCCGVGTTRPLKLIHSKFSDNPSLTEAYLDRLRALTGVRRDRYYEGIWRLSEGGIYDGWDASVHLVDSTTHIGADWPRYLAIDFGFTNPFVCQWWAQDPDGRLVRYRELYRTQSLVEDMAHEIRRHSAAERIKAIVCDHDAEDRATLERHLGCSCVGYQRVSVGTTAARKDVSPGIQAVAQRLKRAGDGRPRLALVSDALISRDPLLDERKLPCSTEEEVEGYVWDTAAPKVNPDGTYRKEEPLKVNDHGMDAMRYMVAYFDLRDPREAAMMKTAPLVQGHHPVKPNSTPPAVRIGNYWPEIKGF